jgi:hypothetical protein
MALRYACNLELSKARKEEDEEHGIFEREGRVLELNTDNSTFKFNYDYYYESEGPNYKLNSCTKNLTEMNGTFEKQGSKITLTISSGSQTAYVSIA